MKTGSYIIIICACILCLTWGVQAEAAEDKSSLLQQFPDIAADLNNGMEGRHFLLAFPPNEADDISIINQELSILVTSRFDTPVKFTVPQLGIGHIIKNVRAGETAEFSVFQNDFTWALEVRESEVTGLKVILIESDHPVTVRAYSAKRFSSDGFLVRPTATWGREYTHISYYDYPESSTNVNRAGGFIIIAQENETDVSIRLKGQTLTGTSEGGRAIGDQIPIQLQANQLYMLRGNATDETFDLTGTTISASKPIGVIAFHQRTVIPVAAGQNSRDALMEMLAPAQTTGLTHYTRELDRNGRGDYFRIMALEDDTEIEIRSYAIEPPHKLLAVRNSTILQAGSWNEFEEIDPQSGSESIGGVSVWTSDKPTVLMQYSYSNFWDNSANYDPFMMRVPPLEQFIPLQAGSTIEPPNLLATTRLNLFVELDADAESPADSLAKILVNGEALTDLLPQAASMRIPESNVYAFMLSTARPDKKYIVSSPFNSAVQLYGYTALESFGWADLQGANFLHTGDVLAPELQRDLDQENAGELHLTATEPRPDDSGITALKLIPEYSRNIEVDFADEFFFARNIRTASLRLRAVNTNRSSAALVLARDRAGNVNVRTYYLNPDSLRATPTELDFGLVRVNNTVVRDVTITNTNAQELTASTLNFGGSDRFSWAGGDLLPAIIAPDSALNMRVQYTPLTETALESIPDDEAVLTIEFMPLGTVNVNMLGRGGIPRITTRVEPFDSTAVGAQTCVTDAVTITSSGTFPLEINGVNELAEPFSLDKNLTGLPATLDPGASIVLGPICFTPADTGTFQRFLQLNGDTENQDNLRVPLLAVGAELPDTTDTGSKLDTTVATGGSPSGGTIYLPVDTMDPDTTDTLITPGLNNPNVIVNPTDGILRFEWIDAPAADITIAIYDIRGALLHNIDVELLSTDPRVFEVNIRSLSNGQYLFALTWPGNIQAGSFVYVR